MPFNEHFCAVFLQKALGKIVDYIVHIHRTICQPKGSVFCE